MNARTLAFAALITTACGDDDIVFVTTFTTATAITNGITISGFDSDVADSGDDTSYTTDDATGEIPTTGTTEPVSECPMTSFCDLRTCPPGSEQMTNCSALHSVCSLWPFPEEACDSIQTTCQQVNADDATACKALSDFGVKIHACGDVPGDGGLLDECLCLLACAAL